uniref:Uncharacterized protein n=2 Tax=Anguilla anguilla TaxID=7936 RepID=A0A0E9XMX1_ANGAN
MKSKQIKYFLKRKKSFAVSPAGILKSVQDLHQVNTNQHFTFIIDMNNLCVLIIFIIKTHSYISIHVCSLTLAT